MKGIKGDQVIDHFCGFHTCMMCGEYNFEGSIKIRHKNKVYCCPRGVEHYIDFHDYKPDDEVIEAILHGKIITAGDIFDDIVKKYPKEIEKARIKNKKEIEESDKRYKEAQKQREDYMNSLTPQQRHLIKAALGEEKSSFVSLEE